MRISHQLRAGLIGLIAVVGASVSSAAYADSGIVRFSVLKAGWFIGGSGGSGVLTFHGRRYPVSIGGLSAGLVFGASETHFVGTVTNIFRPSDVAGVYGAAGAGAAIVGGAGAIVLTNEKGAVLSLSGRQIGLIANLDLSGMAISIR
jgi:lipid-binding SYLF domain-containing protein